MALAGAGRSHEVDHLSPGDKAQLGQRVDAVPIQRGLEGEVVAGERLDRRQPAHAQRRLDAAVLAKGQLLAQQDVDRFQRADLPMLQAAYDLVQRLQGAGHFQADQVAADALDQGRRQSGWRAHARPLWASWRPMAS